MPSDNLLFLEIQSQAMRRIQRSRLLSTNLYIQREILPGGSEIRARHQIIDWIAAIAGNDPFSVALATPADITGEGEPNRQRRPLRLPDRGERRDPLVIEVVRVTR